MEEDGRRLWSRESLNWCSLASLVRLSSFFSFLFWILLSLPTGKDTLLVFPVL